MIISMIQPKTQQQQPPISTLGVYTVPSNVTINEFTLSFFFLIWILIRIWFHTFFGESVPPNIINIDSGSQYIRVSNHHSFLLSFSQKKRSLSVDAVLSSTNPFKWWRSLNLFCCVYCQLSMQCILNIWCFVMRGRGWIWFSFWFNWLLLNLWMSGAVKVSTQIGLSNDCSLSVLSVHCERMHLITNISVDRSSSLPFQFCVCIWCQCFPPFFSLCFCCL